MQRRSTWTTLLRLSSVAALALVGCAKPAPPSFGVLQRPPIMDEATEEQAAREDGTPLAEFGWECMSYSAYIEALRGGR